MRKLAFSNTAWCAEEEEEVAQLLTRFGVQGVEVALSRVWADPSRVREEEWRAYRKFWNDRGIEVIALQNLLDGQKLSSETEARQAFLAELKQVAHLGTHLGARVLVLGSVENLTSEFELATDIFAELGEYAHAQGAVFCIEPGHSEAASSEAAALVRAVSSPGFGLYLDAAAMVLAKEDLRTSLAQHLPELRHFHLSAPSQAVVDSSSPVDYGAALEVLDESAYQRWISVEMKATSRDNRARVERALDYVTSWERDLRVA